MNIVPAALAAALIVVVMVTVTACGQSKGKVASSAVKEVVRSQSNSGGQISISHHLPEIVVIDELVTVLLSFQLEPFQSLEVDITESESFQLISDAALVLEGSDSGFIEASVQLLPKRAGKAYLKLIAATVDGEKIRSYAIRLNVTDESGKMPDKQRQPKHRIDLPSTIH